MKKYLDWTEESLKYCWKRVENSCENDDLSLSNIRIIYGLLILLFFGTGEFSWIAAAPQSFFFPPRLSISNLFNGFPNYYTLLAADISILLLFVCLTLGIKARIAGITLCTIHFIFSSFAYSFGKIDHGSILFYAFILGLSFTNWGTRNALVPDTAVAKPLQRRVLAVLGILVAFGMFTAGLQKAVNWFDFDLNTGGFLSWFYSGYFTLGRGYLLAPLVLKVPPRAFELADYSAVLFELIPFAALLAGRRYWFTWLLTACIFHAANILLLNIDFARHIPVYLTFVPLSLDLRKKLDKTFPREVNYILKIAAITFVAVVAFSYLGDFIFGDVFSPINTQLVINEQFDNAKLASLYTSLCLWCVTAIIICFAVVSTFKSNKQRL